MSEKIYDSRDIYNFNDISVYDIVLLQGEERYGVGLWSLLERYPLNPRVDGLLEGTEEDDVEEAAQEAAQEVGGRRRRVARAPRPDPVLIPDFPVRPDWIAVDRVQLWLRIIGGSL